MRRALELGYLAQAQLQEARSELTRRQAADESAGLLQILAEHYLRPEQVAELRRVYMEASSADPAAHPSVDRGGATQSGDYSRQGPASGGAFAAVTSTQLGPGARVGSYVIEKELARGGMGAVFVARHVELDREVALKVVLNLNPRARGRFVREAQLTAKLRHPNVVRVHEAAVEGPLPYLVMDLVEGESLRQRIEREGPLDPREAAGIAEKVARGLHAAHEVGVLHRDMKPDNVLLDAGRGGEPLVADFGLARDVEAQGGTLTKTGQILGTPAFLPPEQAKGDRALIDARSDVYSLGGTLYFMLTARTPFEGEGGINMIVAAVAHDPDPPSKHRRGLDRHLEAICLKCLRKSPEERYPSAEALADDLVRWRSGEPVTATARARLSTPLLFGLVVFLLCAGVAAAIVLSGPKESEALAALPVPDPEKKPTGALDPKRIEAGRVELGRLVGLDPAKRLDAVDHWLETYPNHPRQEDARALRAGALLEVPLRTFAHPGCWGAVFLPDGRRGLTYGASPVVLWDLETGQQLGRWDLPAQTLALRPDGAGFACAAGPLVSWVPLSGEVASLGRLGASTVKALAWSPSGGRLALGGGHQEVVVLDMPSGAELARLGGHGSPVTCLAFADEEHLISGCGKSLGRERSGGDFRPADNSVRVWGLSRPAAPLRRIGFGGQPQGLGCNPDGGRYAVACDGFRLVTYPVDGSRPLHNFLGESVAQGEGGMIVAAHSGTIRGVVWGRRGQRIVSVSNEVEQKSANEVRLWEPSGQELWRSLNRAVRPAGADLSADEQRLLVATEDGAELWDLAGLAP